MLKIKKITYDCQKYNFRATIEELLGIADLEGLHHRFSNMSAGELCNVAQQVRDQTQTKMQKVEELLEYFFSELVIKLFGPIRFRQKVATIRVQLALPASMFGEQRRAINVMSNGDFLRKYYFNSPNIKPFHRDGDYRVAKQAINLWVPVTNVFGANSLWIGGPELAGLDAEPIYATRGECIFFDGVNRWHGPVANTSTITRVSFDTRFIVETESTESEQLRWRSGE
jgi:hypothetical protein